MNLSLALGRRGAAGGGHGDVDRPGPSTVQLTVRVVELVTLTEVPAVDAEVDRGATPATKPVPTIVTVFPPASGPLRADTAVTVGTGS